MKKKVKALITQSNYIPWKGYFDNIAQADVFVIYDDMQYTKRDWRNRNKVKTPGGVKWLSIPVEVKGKYFQKINETKISEKDWNVKHFNAIKAHYSHAKYFKENIAWIEELYGNCNMIWLTEINRYFIESVMSYLDISTEIRDSREFELVDGKTEKLVGICGSLKANQYITGFAAKNYMDETLFSERGIDIIYSSYDGYLEYPQVHPPFEHGVTIFDVIFNTGSDALGFLKLP